MQSGPKLQNRVREILTMPNKAINNNNLIKIFPFLYKLKQNRNKYVNFMK